MDVEEVRRLIRKETAGRGGQTRWAKVVGCSSSFVSEVLSADRNPSDTMLDVLGLEKLTIYRKKR